MGNEIDAVELPLQSSDDDDRSSEKDAPQSRAEKSKDNDDIAALTEGLGSVSIDPKPSVKGITTPEEIKDIAALLSSNKYKNIVILTGAGVSCNAGIPDFRTPGTGTILFDIFSIL